jgi:hypothetical protein
MDTQFKISTYDRWVSSSDYGFAAETARYSHEAPEERNHIAKGIIYSLPISALLWCGLLAMLLHR